LAVESGINVMVLQVLQANVCELCQLNVPVISLPFAVNVIDSPFVITLSFKPEIETLREFVLPKEPPCKNIPASLNQSLPSPMASLI
jgi:hypothetical protein